MLFQTNYAFYQDSEDLEQTVNTTRPAAVDIQLKLYAIFMPLIGILIIVLNLAIVISSGLILHRGQQPRSTYIFLGNVALSDLLIGVAILFGHFYPKNLRHEMACCIQVGMIVSATITSGYSVGLIAVDRYLYILYGLQYQRYIYPNRARIMILMSWLLGLILGFLPAMGVRNDTNNGKLCWFIILVPPELVLTTTTFGMIPLAVIIVLYSIILRHALKKISQLKKAARDNRGTHSGNLRLFRGGHYSRGSTISVLENDARQCDSEQEQPFRKKIFKCFKQSKNKKENLNIAPVYNPSKWKAIKIVLYTTGSYFVTWFPFFLASALFATCNPNRTPIFCDALRVAIASPLAILGFTNSLLNPIIYAWWHNGFRESVKKIYRGICGDKYNKNDFSDSSKQRNTVSFRSGNTALTDLDSSDNEQKVIHVRNSVIPETESTNL